MTEMYYLKCIIFQKCIKEQFYNIIISIAIGVIWNMKLRLILFINININIRLFYI